eukprot:TRINITY_DN6969_c0_g1_i2.p1 TRINITY_DN6969_c0_g1~~TRINITY_DN6969_c0_g1_i2.p1  ORF type:complete len:527 (-),score=78.40 TRINITY_DN6969_c0_g1_i2:22-1602(-)
MPLCSGSSKQLLLEEQRKEAELEEIIRDLQAQVEDVERQHRQLKEQAAANFPLDSAFSDRAHGLQLWEERTAAEELGAQRSESAALAKVLRSWRGEAQAWTAEEGGCSCPWRPQVLVEAWVKHAGKELQNDNATLLGEQWLEYEQACVGGAGHQQGFALPGEAKATSSKSLWELPLARRLCLSRQATGKALWPSTSQVALRSLDDQANFGAMQNPTWPGTDTTAAAAAAAFDETKPSPWTLRLNLADFMPPDLSGHAGRYAFELDSLCGRVAEDSREFPLDSHVVIQVWRLGGSTTLAPGERRPPTTTATTNASLDKNDSHWTLMLESAPVLLRRSLAAGSSFFAYFRGPEGKPQFSLDLPDELKLLDAEHLQQLLEHADKHDHDTLGLEVSNLYAEVAALRLECQSEDGGANLTATQHDIAVHGFPGQFPKTKAATGRYSQLFPVADLSTQRLPAAPYLPVEQLSATQGPDSHRLFPVRQSAALRNAPPAHLQSGGAGNVQSNAKSDQRFHLFEKFKNEFIEIFT